MLSVECKSLSATAAVLRDMLYFQLSAMLYNKCCMWSFLFFFKATLIKVDKLGIFFSWNVSYMNLLMKELDAVKMIC